MNQVMFSLILVVLCIAVQMSMSDYVDRMNMHRNRYRIENMRKVYKDADLESKAMQAAKECKMAVKDGMYGVAYGKFAASGSSSVITRVIDSWGKIMREGIDRRTYACKDGYECNNFYQLTEPTAYKAGCGQAVCNDEMLIVCYFNRIAEGSTAYKRGQECSACTASFSECNDKMCAFPGDKVPDQAIPEDAAEVGSAMKKEDKVPAPAKKPEENETSNNKNVEKENQQENKTNEGESKPETKQPAGNKEDKPSGNEMENKAPVDKEADSNQQNNMDRDAAASVSQPGDMDSNPDGNMAPSNTPAHLIYSVIMALLAFHLLL